jgi:DNA-directed RNA polymerase specialized sigma24 family protein
VPEAGYDTPPASGPDETLWRLLATLPPKQRAVIVLRLYEDLTEVEVARVLDCSVGTVKSNGSRGLARLRRALTAGGGRRATGSSRTCGGCSVTRGDYPPLRRTSSNASTPA